MYTFIKHVLFVSLVMTLLAACAPAKTSTPIPPDRQTDNPYAPQPGDETLVHDSVEIVKAETIALESAPVQFVLKVSFFTPTPCHQFRIVVDQPTANRQIKVEVYSLMKKDQVCTLMRTQNPTEASLNLGSLTAGHYTVWINDVKSVEFDA